MAIDLVLKGGAVVTEGGPVQADIAVSGGVITALTAPGDAPHAHRVVDVTGLHVLPGVIDSHSHHREPGFTHKEDIVTATSACAAGGVTVSCAMPNVYPPPTTPAILKDMFALYEKKSLIDYNINAAASNLEAIPDLAQMGILSFKIFMVVDTGRDYPHMPGIGVHDHGKLLAIFEKIQKTGLPIMVHPHDQAIMDHIEQGFWARGERDFRAYAKAYSSMDGVIWDTAVGVLLRLQQATGVHLHILHLQTRQCVEMIKAARAQGRAVTSEVNPWTLWLGNDWANIERLGSYALSYYVERHHYEAVWQALLDGTSDMIATDHAPHTRAEKEPGWENGWKAHTGTPSAQEYVSMLMTDVNDGKISLKKAVELLSENPAKVFKLYPKKGAIRIGADADFAVVDMNAELTLNNERILSKCGWTPYAGKRVKGVPLHTIVRGKFVFENGKIAGEPGHGEKASPLSVDEATRIAAAAIVTG
ncbi:MAG TPA: dihydroorotase family protein [Bryobacteraceae bacterium]|nr:dihydroorotase family protein [Bryobacteraceae bacterium]